MRLIRSNQPPIVPECYWLATEVDANVEAVVIPIRLAISAPFPVLVHPGDVAIHLAGVLAETAGVAVNPGSIRLQPATTVFLIVAIPICPGSGAHGQHEPSGQRGTEQQSTPNILIHHEFLLGDKLSELLEQRRSPFGRDSSRVRRSNQLSQLPLPLRLSGSILRHCDQASLSVKTHIEY